METRLKRTWFEGLTLETSAFESFYGGQFTLSTQLIKPNYLNEFQFTALTTLRIEGMFGIYNQDQVVPSALEFKYLSSQSQCIGMCNEIRCRAWI